MKHFTIKGLSEVTNVAAGTIRAWIMKPIDGQPYSSENVNYSNLQEKLNKYFENFEERFGFKVEEIEIVKAERASKKWVDLNELEVDKIYVLHNYSLKTELKFVRYIEDLDGYIFTTTDEEKFGFKMYAGFQLNQENIKIEKVEA